MSATLPAASMLAPGHKITPTEWTQILTAITAITNIRNFNYIASLTLSSSSASYVDITGATGSITKVYASGTSDILAICGVSSRSGTAGSTITVAVNDGTNDNAAFKYIHNTANQHNFGFGAVRITGLAAGALSMKLRAKSSGATMTIDANDVGFLWLWELPK
ncbi:MAG TPA: hypothetical protein VIY48_01450 [Candidatus Paceibacterota bacterium]